jgi:hypothetical protein
MRGTVNIKSTKGLSFGCIEIFYQALETVRVTAKETCKKQQNISKHHSFTVSILANHMMHVVVTDKIPF